MIRETNKKLEKEVVSFFDPIFKKLKGDYIIAGGSVLAVYKAARNEESLADRAKGIKDADLFFKTLEDYNETFCKLQDLQPRVPPNNISFASGVRTHNPNSCSFKTDFVDIDLINKEYYPEGAEEVLRGFDLDICCIGISCDRTLVYTEEFTEAFKSGVFGLNCVPDKHIQFESTLRRVARYIDKGYDFDQVSLSELLEVGISERWLCTCLPEAGGSGDDSNRKNDGPCIELL